MIESPDDLDDDIYIHTGRRNRDIAGILHGLLCDMSREGI